MSGRLDFLQLFLLPLHEMLDGTELASDLRPDIPGVLLTPELVI